VDDVPCCRPGSWSTIEFICLIYHREERKEVLNYLPSSQHYCLYISYLVFSWWFGLLEQLLAQYILTPPTCIQAYRTFGCFRRILVPSLKLGHRGIFSRVVVLEVPGYQQLPLRNTFPEIAIGHNEVMYTTNYCFRWQATLKD
jgi:hypothetical protein